MAEQIDRDRFSTMAQSYDQMVPYLLPKYDFLQSEVLSLAIAQGIGGYIVDLGAGSGRFLEKALSLLPGARAVWVDSSRDFLAVASRRLEAFAGRVQFVLCDLDGPWEHQLQCRPDVIFSMSAIHHLESAGKRRVYQRCLEVLEPCGWFFNVDEMSTLYDDAYRRTLQYWASYVDRAHTSVPLALQEYCCAWCDRFELWKQRNVFNADVPKQKGDDIHESFVQQVKWLRELGYVNVDLFVKFQLWSVIGGQKPATDENEQTNGATNDHS